MCPLMARWEKHNKMTWIVTIKQIFSTTVMQQSPPPLIILHVLVLAYLYVPGVLSKFRSFQPHPVAFDSSSTTVRQFAALCSHYCVLAAIDEVHKLHRLI